MSLLERLRGYFGKLWLKLVLIVGLGIYTAVRIYFASDSRREAEKPKQEAAPRPPGNTSAAKDPLPQPVSMTFGETVSDFVIPPQIPKKDEAPPPPPIPDEIKRQLVNLPTPISLFPPEHTAPKPPPPGPPLFYLPSFRLIRCELIGGPETGSIETPLIGIVLDDQYAIGPDGVTRLVIPARVEVHGTGKSAPSRDRIDGGGKWTFVWRTAGKDNGMELSVSALALNRDYDETKHVYGDSEKSPGIAGQRFQSLGDQAIEEALLASVAAIARNAKSTTSILNPLTSQVVQTPSATIGNALLEGGAAGTDRIAQMLDDLRKQIDDKGYYVAVLPGKEFYLYTKEPIDLRNVRRPGSAESNAKPSTHL